MPGLWGGSITVVYDGEVKSYSYEQAAKIMRTVCLTKEEHATKDLSSADRADWDETDENYIR